MTTTKQTIQYTQKIPRKKDPARKEKRNRKTVELVVKQLLDFHSMSANK